LRLFPFFTLIKENETGKKLLDTKDVRGLLEFILGAEGLNYGGKPKPDSFSSPARGHLRTALEEHLVEAAGYAHSDGVSHIHFTLAAGHRSDIESLLGDVLGRYERLGRIRYEIDLSFQSASSDTIAVDENILPLRNARGELVFRPGGMAHCLTI